MLVGNVSDWLCAGGDPQTFCAAGETEVKSLGSFSPLLQALAIK